MERSQAHPMEELKRMLERILDVIPPGSNIVYVDYPVHENIGDLLILQGTERFFQDHGIRVRKRLSYLQFRKGMRLPPEWIVVCHGGGNFGDLYPANQKLRETLARTYPANRIVVLPQTVYFSDEEERERSLAVFASHPDFHLFVRDRVSYDLAADRLPRVYLSPDMAHQLYPIESPPSPAGPRLGILRTDGEAAREGDERVGCDIRTDWPELLSKADYAMQRVLVLASSLDRYLLNLLPVRPLWYRLANRFVAKAVRLYGSCGSVVTSRLHGHILACLMGVPNRLLDNNYGKNGSYYRQWTYRVREGKDFENGTGNDLGGMYAESS
ncbi:polysaccharide pyruvyl transferase family protein [Cohnella candidum]|uniref:Exopolysaccharide biosynthesis protein n=1 Tax=Cohnella candidum TaxID=2674991 RepID=A0A3G3K016_9BACL|nr:polysaccharide pyruvyl transferase family protein [Cohnella candidum]AYQ73846.1 exopolysaccharide biosynthesis protein [Cohnella candidum]